MGKKLHHCYIAGITSDEAHALVYYADNKELLSKQLQPYKNYPIILEGVINEHIPKNKHYNMLENEITYLKSLF